MDTNRRNTDEQEIRAVVQQAVEAWNSGDGSAYAALFAEDADYVTFGGMHTRGRHAIATEHQQLFDAFLRGSRLALQITNLRFLGPDTALVHAVGGILDQPDQRDVALERRSIQTAVLCRQHDTWRIVATQVTRIQTVLPGINVPAQVHNLHHS